MPSQQVASARNRAEARRTNTRARRNRITNEVNRGANNRGDFNNSRAVKNTNSTLAQQNFGTHNQRYRDLVAAFGRVTNEGPGNGSAKLSFSAG